MPVAAFARDGRLSYRAMRVALGQAATSPPPKRAAADCSITSGDNASVRKDGRADAIQSDMRQDMYLHRSLPLALVLAAAAASLATAGPVHNAPSKSTYISAPPATAGSSFTAVVNSKARLVRGTGATGALRPDGKGTTEIDFTNDVSGCAFVATVGETGSDGFEPASFITVVGRSGTPQGVYVETYSLKGKLANLPFHLDVGC